ncbi:type III pantothenate kinase [Colwellia sp. 1_MG-2023]|uniref:type III pantothenate kinase n=1 Tax=Colwellia sp. 1_MG-2023 TaxID=3062649 RepID=UPI0026E2CF95|nr:type III pantothenate kinase [Colwellia sp. 1_MG-2023]MDO6445526.1 type III pantothenate kinase [Colwellia sp. 1_MG-2023]
MKLLIDVGNTLCKYVTFQQGELSAVTSIESHLINQQWLTKNFPAVAQCIVSNVNDSQINQTISLWCESQNIAYCFVKSETEKFNLRCAYDDPSTFGVDRWLGLIGASTLFPNQAALIIDVGTATTIDLLTSSGVHQGGWILPGIELMFSSVTNNTKKVIATPKEINQIAFANNTSDAVNQANWAATIGCINIAIASAHSQYLSQDESLKIILTGGNAAKLKQLMAIECEYIEKLIFVGINRYDAKNCA